jgi:hypothetical protein
MLAEKNPVIREAYCKLRVMSEDEANRMPCEARLKAQRDEYSRIQGAWQEVRKMNGTRSSASCPASRWQNWERRGPYKARNIRVSQRDP